MKLKKCNFLIATIITLFSLNSAGAVAGEPPAKTKSSAISATATNTSATSSTTSSVPTSATSTNSKPGTTSTAASSNKLTEEEDVPEAVVTENEIKSATTANSKRIIKCQGLRDGKLWTKELTANDCKLQGGQEVKIHCHGVKDGIPWEKELTEQECRDKQGNEGKRRNNDWDRENYQNTYDNTTDEVKPVQKQRRYKVYREGEGNRREYRNYQRNYQREYDGGGYDGGYDSYY